MFRTQISRQLLQRSRPLTRTLQPSLTRPLSTTPRLFTGDDRKTQSKDDLNPQSSEYSQTGSDDAVASNEDAAFNPDKTKPEESMNTSKKESSGQDPLQGSPGNKEASKPRDPQEGGPSQGTGSGGSGGGSAPKAGGSGSG